MRLLLSEQMGLFWAATLLVLSVEGCNPTLESMLDRSPSTSGGATQAETGPAGHRSGVEDDQHHTGPVAGRPTTHSLYHLEALWTNQFGERLTLADLGSRVQVVAMVYTHCTFACPRIMAQMKSVESRLAGELGDGFGLTLVSIDPGRDTPGRLLEFATSTHLDLTRWTLLSGSAPDVLALSVLLGVKYQATAEGEFAHSNILTVLNRNGEIAYTAEGLDADLDPVVEVIRTESLGAS